MTTKTLLQTIGFFICFIFLIGCGEEKPEDVLSEEEMTALMLDIHLGEGKIANLNVNRDSALILFENYENRIFENYSFTREEYVNSLNYYYDHPEDLEKIYDNVLDSLNISEQKLKKEEEEKQKAKEEETERGKEQQ